MHAHKQNYRVNSTIRVRDIPINSLMTIIELLEGESRGVGHEEFSTDEAVQKALKLPDKMPDTKLIPLPKIFRDASTRRDLSQLVFNSTPVPTNDPKPWIDYAGHRYAGVWSDRRVRLRYAPRQRYMQTRRYNTNQALVDLHKTILDHNYSRKAKITLAIRLHNKTLRTPGVNMHTRKVCKRYIKLLKSLDIPEPGQ